MSDVCASRRGSASTAVHSEHGTISPASGHDTSVSTLLNGVNQPILPPWPGHCVPDTDEGPKYIIIQGCPTKCHPDVPNPQPQLDRDHVEGTVLRLLQGQGRVVRIQQVKQIMLSPTQTWIVEYHDSDSVFSVVDKTASHKGKVLVENGVYIWALIFHPIAHLEVAVHEPLDAIQCFPPGTSQGDVSIGLYERAMVRRMVPLGKGINIVDQWSRPDPSSLSPERQQDFFLTFHPDLTASMQFLHMHRDLANTVVYAKIRHGQDVRTTVMIRNIPNCVKQDDLVLLLNDCVPGLFDFVYLRIDFTNGCNVGYGFVNFLRADVILELIDAICFKRWHNSFKTAEVCYATWQGSEAMVAKFRNSAVMVQHPSARPKLFYTLMDGTLLCGLERPFPSPDNEFKLQQSLKNQGCIGLYPRRNMPPGAGTSMARRLRQGSLDPGNPRDVVQQQRNHGPIRRNGFQFGDTC